jgi:hypothetical protein
MSTSRTPTFRKPLHGSAGLGFPFPSGSCSTSSSSGDSLSSTVGLYAYETNLREPPYVTPLGYFESDDSEKTESPELDATESRVSPGCSSFLEAATPLCRLRLPDDRACSPAAHPPNWKRGRWSHPGLVSRLRLDG